ncbi:MAG: TonB-dependent receptor [Marinilabiliaceae bacterium]|nr:TonB-dependent receptor [Marinilabiliaceae bacterium]
MKYKFLITLFLLFVSHISFSSTGDIRGTVIEKATGEPIPGATIFLRTSNTGTITDFDGNYTLKASEGTHTLRISFVSYNTVELNDVIVEADKTTTANIAMESSTVGLDEVVVLGMRRMNTEVSMISAVRHANFVASGVSAQQISRTQDRDASEVIKRVPGVTIIDNRFIIARGLSQRYNNVWVNNNAVPSSEAETRAFSFDMLPSGQIENLMIVKSPAPELPADFSGGFVKVATKSNSDENMLQVSYGININSVTHFKDFKYSTGSPTDFLGFDNGFRDMQSVVPKNIIDSRDRELVSKVTANGFNNDWIIHSKKPIVDHRFSVMLNRFKKMDNGMQMGVVAALNHSYSYLNFQNMTNARFGVYNKRDDEPLYLYKYADDQYTISAKTGGLLNLIWTISNNHKLEFRNIFNQNGRDRYTYRDGWQNISARYEQQKEEYLYTSRSIYTGQLAGNHSLSEISKLDWTLGYSYSNKNQPDRRQIDREEEIDKFIMNSIIRDFIRLDENSYSGGVNFNQVFSLGTIAPTLKTGGYAEYKERHYDTRYFIYFTNMFNLPADFRYRDVATEMMLPEYFSEDKFFISDASRKTNNYSAENLLLCGYAGLNVPLGNFNIYAGLRYENNDMSLINYVTLSTDETETFDYITSDFFPSVNATYNINKTNLVRIAYGKSINRQEFREVTPSAYYDFELFSFVRGNKNLKQAYIQNFDLRYEIYPTTGEMLSFALFYKNFTNPIEWTFIDSGGTYTFTFENAERADNYGIELEIRKSLDFMGMPNFLLSFNGALIDSEVKFGDNSLEHDRPMQGQSPYIVNSGLFYQREKLNVGLMYNIIGKRIVGIGRNDNSQGGSIDNDVPDMFEMPRHVFDMSISFKIGARMELSAGIRDILASPVVFKQFPKYRNGGNIIHSREQTTREYKPGQNFSVSVRVSI